MKDSRRIQKGEFVAFLTAMFILGMAAVCSAALVISMIHYIAEALI